jgi:hypothetical protein
VLKSESNSGSRLIIFFVFLIVFLFEQRSFFATVFSAPALRFPLFDTKLADSNSTFLFLEVLFLGLVLLITQKRLRIPAALLAAVTGASLVLLDLQNRYQFNFLPAWTLLAYAFSESQRKRGKDANSTVFPYIALLFSIYAFAAFHKAINFSFMLTELPGDLFMPIPGLFGPLCTSPNCTLLETVAWITIPIEVGLSLLLLRKNWLKPRLILAILFHWPLAITHVVFPVSVSLLLLQLLIARLQQPQIAILKDRRWSIFLLIESIWFLCSYVLPAQISPVWQVLVVRFAWSSLSIFPIVFLLLPYLFGPRSRQVSRAPAPVPSGFASAAALARGRLGASALIFVLGLTVFGFSPLLLREPYSVYSLGWAMFSGGYLRSSTKYLRTPADDCHYYPDVWALIYSKHEGNEFVYNTKRQVDLDRLSNYFSTVKKCPN